MASDDDNDFPFAFGATSDNEDEGDDGLFCAPKAKVTTNDSTRAAGGSSFSSSSRNATMDILKEQERYEAQIDEEGWFHHIEKPIRELMLQDKNGATKVKMQADYCYMLHRYQEALDIAQEYCRVVAENEAGHSVASGDNTDTSNGGTGGMQRSGTGTHSTNGAETGGILKVTDTKEMQEMVARCLLKLNRPGEAVTIADGLVSQETSIAFLKANIYTAVGRYNDAAITLVEYQRSRSSNYAVWKALGECFHEASIHSSRANDNTTSSTLLHDISAISLSSTGHQRHLASLLALISILRARHLMRVSVWSQVSYASERYQREMTAIEAQRSIYEKACGLSSMKESQNEFSEEAMRIQEYETEVVTPSREALQQLKRTSNAPQDNNACFFPLVVVEMVVNSWDPQLIEHSALQLPAEDKDQTAEPSVRSK
ncbi:hypothetical protein EMPS_04976 [Entomortierella parvispora]|uniref:Uncharacterized protein n=1 Tax=Entomortierella parvispora TaxID=205924 RepID=A0A9P3HA70_9FUNG|nr:hypothetical protein EMPS_04976 [Entomortierella parvispora]